VSGLDLYQSCSDEQKLARHLEIKVAHGVEISYVLVDDVRQTHFGDDKLVRRDQLEEQVEGTFEYSGANFERHLGPW